MPKDPKIPQRLRVLLQDIVRAQDEGYAMYEELEKARFGHSFIHSLAVEVDAQRGRMVHDGQEVYARTGNSFHLGLDSMPFKDCAHRWEWDQIMSENENKEVHICHRCGSRRRVDTTPEKPESEESIDPK